MAETTIPDVALAKQEATKPTSPKAATNGAAVSTNGYRPISLSEFRANERSVSVDWMGQSITAVYKPAVMDRSHYAGLRELDEDLPMSEWAVVYCSQILAGIPSLCADDGSSLVMDEATLSGVPSGLLTEIITAIRNDLLPKVSSAESSSSAP